MRHLAWDGSVNVRDLGGLAAADGRRVRPGALIRGDTVDRLSEAGWASLRSRGVGTIVDLRNDDERDPLVRPPFPVVHLPLDGVEDREFWDVWASGPAFGTPLYYEPFLRRFPRRAAAVVAAIAQAPPGGVLFHCVRGRDRTGLVALLVLSLLGVAPVDVAADYACSADRLRLADPHAEEIEAFLLARGTTPAALVLELLGSLDLEVVLRAGGLTDADLAALRARSLG